MDRPKLAKDLMVTRLATLSPDGDVFKAMGLLLKKRISGTPVVDDQRNVVGVFSEKCCMRVLTTAVRLAGERGDTHGKPVVADKLSKDIMITKLVTLKPDRDVFEAIGYLLKHRVSGAPVIDDQRNFLGIFSENTSMTVLLDAAHQQMPGGRVGAFLDPDLGRTVAEDKDLLSLAQMFLDTLYRRLPVLRDG